MVIEKKNKSLESQNELETQRELLVRAKNGDEKALWDLFSCYADVLYGRVLLPRLGDPDAAKDILKESFIHAMKKIDTFEWKGISIYGWIRRITINKAIDYHRKAGRFQRMVDRLAVEEKRASSTDELADMQLIAAEERKINKQRVHKALKALKPRYQKVLTLRLLEERSRKECAELLNVSLGNFDVLFFRSVNAFKKVFGET